MSTVRKAKMPKKRAVAKADIIEKVVASNDEVVQARSDYHQAQDVYLGVLREARDAGETLENLADALGCSKQWVHKWTTFGRDHNKVHAGRTAA
jgi:hypothetical protein